MLGAHKPMARVAQRILSTDCLDKLLEVTVGCSISYKYYWRKCLFWALSTIAKVTIQHKIGYFAGIAMDLNPAFTEALMVV